MTSDEPREFLNRGLTPKQQKEHLEFLKRLRDAPSAKILPAGKMGPDGKILPAGKTGPDGIRPKECDEE